MKTAMPKILMKAVFPVVCMVGMLHGLDVIAAGWSQNLDAKPVELPCGLKFGEVYEGAIRSTKPNYMNGIESKHCEAVITNDWLGFKEIVVSMTGKRRVSGVLGMKLVPANGFVLALSGFSLGDAPAVDRAPSSPSNGLDGTPR